MIRVRQNFQTDSIHDVESTVLAELNALGLGEKVQLGQSVAITAGSRGIAGIDKILRSIVRHLKEIGCEPFIVPAMGSHGGATVAGQLQVLADYGITEQQIGCPVKATMDTVVVSETPQGVPVHFDKFAFEADHVVVCNRVKPHTGFVGPIESGLHKMMLIGLGNHSGAKIYHQAIASLTFEEIIRAVGKQVIESCGILAGLAIVENAKEETGHIEAIAPEDFFERETELLKLSKQWLPSLPFNDVDLLIVDRIGKNISGTGMDTNVVGRKYFDHDSTERDDVQTKRIVVRGLTTESHGNATGIGIAEFTTQACVDSVDREKTNVNSVTGNHPEAGMIPLVYSTDAEAVSAGLATIGMVPPANARVIQIADTLHLSECLVSEAYAADCESAEHIEIIEPAAPMDFDAAGNLKDVLA
jgi:hypothetical protein